LWSNAEKKNPRANFQGYFEFFVVFRKSYLSIPRLFEKSLFIFFETLGFRGNVVDNTALTLMLLMSYIYIYIYIYIYMTLVA